jgi:hypothetical protein
MHGKLPLGLLLLGCGILAGISNTALADPPWRTILAFHRPDADPNQAYPVTEQSGPWLITAATFAGEGAEQQAHELVIELRKRYKLASYTHEMHFDFTGSVQGRGLDSTGEPQKMHYRRKKEFEEIAVLVGDFPAIDHPDLQRTLQKIKTAQPEALAPQQGKPSYQQLGAYRNGEFSVVVGGRVVDQRKAPGPMAHAFVTRNPLLPEEYFVAKGVDKLVMEMNKHVTHCLLDCPGKYTVKVATFTGNVTIKPDDIRKIESGEKTNSRLAQAAVDAHLLTEALRAKGYAAYEFHDRYSSIVTVGSFDTIGTKLANGKIDLHPQVFTIMQVFGAERKNVPGQAQPMVGAPKNLAGIPLDVQPIPVEVPKRSIGSDYQASLFGQP